MLIDLYNWSQNIKSFLYKIAQKLTTKTLSPSFSLYFIREYIIILDPTLEEIKTILIITKFFNSQNIEQIITTKKKKKYLIISTWTVSFRLLQNLELYLVQEIQWRDFFVGVDQIWFHDTLSHAYPWHSPFDLICLNIWTKSAIFPDL